MIVESEVEKSWISEVERFISHWEKENEVIKNRALGPDECYKISTMFHEEEDGLLVIRPVEIPKDIAPRLKKLSNKLNSTLAMVCSTQTDITKSSHRKL